MDRQGVNGRSRRRAAVRLRAVAAIAACIAVLMAAAVASAQPAPPAIPEEAVRKMLELGLKNIQRALCDGFNQCTPATPQELENPPISVDQARAAIMVGARSAFAGWCGFDANKRSVLPFLGQLRRSKLYDERQLALMAVVHGIQQSITTEQLKGKGACDQAMRKSLDAQLPKS
jgi:hypothetical protein